MKAHHSLLYGELWDFENPKRGLRVLRYEVFSIVLLTFEDRSSILRRRTTGLPCLGALSRKIGAHRPIVALLTKIFISVIGIGYFVDSLRLFSVKIGS